MKGAPVHWSALFSQREVKILTVHRRAGHCGEYSLEEAILIFSGGVHRFFSFFSFFPGEEKSQSS